MQFLILFTCFRNEYWVFIYLYLYDVNYSKILQVTILTFFILKYFLCLLFLKVQTCMYCISVLERFNLQKWTLKGILPVKCNIHVIRLPPKIHKHYFKNNSEGIIGKILIVKKTGNSIIHVDLVLDTSHKKELQS